MKRIKHMKRLSQSMIEGPLLGGMIRYTIPVILTGILQLLFNAADLVVVGQFCGSNAVGAVGATGAITALMINLFVGISVGVGVTVAHGLGSKNDAEVHKTVHTALLVALISGAILTIIGIAFSGSFLKMMETPDEILPMSTLYMQIYFGGVVFNLVYNFCASILRAAGETKKPLYFLTISGVINVVLNLFFVTVLHMNVAGVALATVTSQAISAVLVVLEMMRRKDACRLSLKKMKIYKPQLLRFLRLGIPAGIQGSLFSISNVIIQSSINSFGELVIAGNAAGANLDAFVYVTMNAFYQAAVNYVGQNSGAGKFDRIKRVFWLSCASAATTGILLGGLLYTFGRPLLSIYITDSDMAIEYGMLRLAGVGLPYFLCGIMESIVGCIRGLGASVSPMLISIVGVCGVRLVWIFTVFQIPAFHTQSGLYLSYPVSWIATALLQAIVFFVVYKQRKKAAAIQTLQSI